jgi:hypothetical protein
MKMARQWLLFVLFAAMLLGALEVAATLGAGAAGGCGGG